MGELKTSGKWGLVAWSGLSLRVPEDWNIGAIGGDQKQGYLRLDDSDMPRTEIKWAQAEGGFANVSSIVDKYLRDIQRGKKGKNTTVKRDLKLATRRKFRHRKGLECFAWRSETQAFGAAWFCPTCSKTVVIQVMGTLQEPVRKVAEQVILSLEDHPADDYLTWSTYGFYCQTPRRFKLVGQKLMAGLISLDLDDEGEHLHLARWGMANIALKGKTLREWGQKELGKRLKRFATEVSEQEYRGHECVAISGVTNLPQEKVKSFVQHCLGKPYPDRVLAYLWCCPEANKILYLEGILDRDSLDLLAEVRERLPCHGQEDETAAPESSPP